MSKLTYDLYVSRLDGSESQLVWSWARQPRFRRWDGRLIFNADGQGKDNLWSVNLDGSDAREVSTHPEDSHPSWSPRGDRLLFDSEFYAWGQSAAQRVWTVWRNDTDQKGIEPQSVEVAGRVIMGRSPIWLENDWVVYNGCNYWENNGSCGLYTAPSWGADRARQITTGADDIATDALGSRITYMSRLDDNWEVYSVGFEGGDAANLTRNPANDGLATVSPDGSKIAFISDRSGVWSIWVMNADGSNPVRMFDLPGPVGPDWTTERMSWGP
jgi:Tol biopolymer transport system component